MSERYVMLNSIGTDHFELNNAYPFRAEDEERGWTAVNMNKKVRLENVAQQIKHWKNPLASKVASRRLF